MRLCRGKHYTEQIVCDTDGCRFIGWSTAAHIVCGRCGAPVPSKHAHKMGLNGWTCQLGAYSAEAAGQRRATVDKGGSR